MPSPVRLRSPPSIPANAQTGVPLNAQITAVMSNNIDPTRVTNSSITVTPSGGSAIAGTVTLAANGVTLTFVPSAALTASKVYNVSVGGFNDIDGNAVTTFTSSFTTGTTTYGSGSFTVVSTSPANGATGVSVTSPVTFTMSNLINAASVNANTVYVYVSCGSDVCGGELQRKWRVGDVHAADPVPGQHADGHVCVWTDGRGGQSGLSMLQLHDREHRRPHRARR